MTRTVATVAVAWIGIACTPASQRADVPPAGSSVPETSAHVAREVDWAHVDTAALSGRDVTYIARGDKELFFLGAQTMMQVPLADSDSGVAFDVEKHTWRPIARGGPTAVASAVWTGDVVFVLARESDAAFQRRAFVYRPATNRWDKITSPPVLPTAVEVELRWTGSEVLAPQLLSAWDPITGLWRSLAPPVDLPTTFKTLAVDAGLIFYSNVGPDYVYRYARDDWAAVRIALPIGAAARHGSNAASIAERLEPGTSTFTLEASLFDTGSLTWQSIAPPPAKALRCAVSAVDVGDGTLFDVCTSLVLLDANGQWHVMTRPGRSNQFFAQLASFGSTGVFFQPGNSGRAGDDAQLFLADLSALVAAAQRGPIAQKPLNTVGVTHDGTVAIGSIEFDIPHGYKELATRIVTSPRRGTELSFSLPIVDPWPPEPPCTMTSWSTTPTEKLVEQWRSRSTKSGAANRLRELHLARGDIDDHEHVVIELSDVEVLDISCAAPFQSGAILGGLR